MSFSLKLFGGVAVAGERGPLTGPAAQRRRLALLALLATARPRGMSRDKLLAWLWPERDIEHARGLLNQAVHSLRRALGVEAIVTAGEELQLNPELVRSDVTAFEEALARGELAQAVVLYTGPFLDGFFLDDAPEFERLVERERDRLAGAYGKALESLAEAAGQAGDWKTAAEWWQARAAHDPYDSGVVLRLMQALERLGNRAGALQHGLAHQRLLREDLEIELAPEVAALAERLRREPPASVESIRSGGSRPATARPAEVTVGEAPVEPASPAPGPSPARRRALLSGVAILLSGFAFLAAIRLVSGRSGGTGVGTAVVVDEIAQAVARELDRRQRGDTMGRLPQNRTRSIPAYEFFLRGTDPALLRSDSAARQGLEYLERAVALDSTYAAAWAGLARLTIRVGVGGAPSSLAQVRAVAEEAARKAVALDDSLGEAHAILGVFHARAWDLPAAEQHFRRAVALEPNRAVIREWLANFYLQAERPVEALAAAEQALAIDPMSPSATAEVARALLANGRCDEALARLETIAALDPPLLRAAPIAAECYGRKGMWTEAIAVLRPLPERDRTLPPALLGYVLVRAGEREEALAIQDRLMDDWRRGALGAFYLAFVPAALGNLDQAFDWLDRAVEDGSLAFGTRTGFRLLPFDDLRRDPRFEQLRGRLRAQNR